jgi:hypothetical protein
LKQGFKIMSFKRIILSDPLAQIPSLELIPALDGYSRATINLRKASSRTLLGATKIQGTNYNPYFQWNISINLISKEKAHLFDDLIEALNNRMNLFGFPEKYLYLTDEFREVPAMAKPRFTFVPGSEVVRPYNGLKSGFGIFRVVPVLSPDYLKEVSGCRFKLSFTADEVR